MIKDAWSGIDLKISKQQYPVFQKEVCSGSGQLPASTPFDQQPYGACAVCGFVKRLRVDGKLPKHNSRRGSVPQDIIILQTGARQRIEIAATDVDELVDQLLALTGRRTVTELREQLYQAEYGTY